MSVVEYRAPTDEALSYIVKHMRDGDVQELRELGCDNPEETVFRSARHSDACFVAYRDGLPAAVFGVGPSATLGRVGVPWLLGTDAVVTGARYLIADGREVVRSWQRRYILLQNVVSVNNKVSVRWLSRLGFTFGEPFATPYRGQAMVFTMEGTRDV